MVDQEPLRLTTPRPRTLGPGSSTTNPRWSSGLLELLLRAEVVGVSTAALAAVRGSGWKSGVAFAANHLLAVVLLRQHAERGLDDAAAKTQHQVERRLLLDVVVGQRATVLQLLAREDQTLLIGRNSLLVLNLGLDIFDGV